MKAEVVLDVVNEIIGALEKDQQEMVRALLKDRNMSFPGVGQLAALKLMAEREISESESNKKPSQLAALKRIMKRGGKTPREDLQYGNTQDGLQYFCDGFVLVGVRKPLSAYENPNPARMTFRKLIPSDAKMNPAVPCPSLAKLKAYQKRHKVAKGERLDYDFGPDKPLVDISILIDMIEAIGEADLYINWRSIYMETEDGIGYLMAIRPKDGAVRKETNLDE